MAITQILSIIKPDAVADGHEAAICQCIEAAGLKIKAKKTVHLSGELAAQFYQAFKNEKYYDKFIAYITSGSSIMMILEGENAAEVFCQIKGATDPKKAIPGTLRAKFGKNITENAVHGSDSENARREIKFFFGENALLAPAACSSLSQSPNCSFWKRHILPGVALAAAIGVTAVILNKTLAP